MKGSVTSVFATIALVIIASVAAANTLPKDIAWWVEAIPIQTLTISDQQFLSGDAAGKPTIIAGTLRIAQGSGRLPLVILMHGSGGFEVNAELWQRQFGSLGISTFALDSFSGRGIASTVTDQSQLGRLNMILDLYRSLAVLGRHPLVDPNRIAVMGFSRGGQAALYATLRRFQNMWNTSRIDPAAYIALYPQCNTTFRDDTDVTDHPIRIFHGISDDYVSIVPCRAYFDRLNQAGKDVQMAEYPDTWHAFDYPSLTSSPTVVRNGQTTNCVLMEDATGMIVNTATNRPFTYADDCVGRDPHVAYSPKASHATEEALRALLKKVFGLN
jgi:dienelactone hydrolase